MRAHWTLVLAGSAGFAALGTATALAGGDEEGVDWTAKAKQAWSKTCTNCHTAPDPQFETGRAFLNQITETS